MVKSKTATRRSTRESWLTEPENPEPAHDPATRYVPAPAKVQALVRHANEAGIRVVSAAEFSRTPGVAATPRGPRVRAPREARSVRRRGSRRGERAKSSSSDDPDPEPPAARPCACGCGRPRQPGKGQNYFDDECRKRHARERKRKQRTLDREEPDRVVERSAAPAERPRCRCHGQGAYEFDHRWVCCACGRPKAGVYSEVNGRLATPEVLEVLAEEARRGARTPGLHREWRTRPTRKLSAKLRKTRGRWDAPAREEVVA